jgi:hypothetical protein
MQLTVHMVPHSHDDVGWLKTYDEYYTGLNEGTMGSKIRVEQILDEIINELIRDPKKVFTYVEMKFFNMWYTRQSAKR